jgi:hypothetical protein
MSKSNQHWPKLRKINNLFFPKYTKVMENKELILLFILIVIIALVDDPLARYLAAIVIIWALYWPNRSQQGSISAQMADKGPLNGQMASDPYGLAPSNYDKADSAKEIPVDYTQDQPMPPYEERAQTIDETAKFGQDELYSGCYEPILSGDLLYDTPYNNFASDISNCCNIYARIGGDEQIARMNIGRFKEKRGQDGWAAKSAAYFKKNYAYEFDEAENRLWWGNSEY